jgi:DNA repair protein SbcC/Rad50
MKPISLEFAGIGSYPGHVSIDFATLNAKGLYLIVGPTGSGKTTLLDAMTFALYGKVPSDRENAIVSLHAHRESPVIEFTFSHGHNTYVVHREPTPAGKQVNTSKQWLRVTDAAGREIKTITGARAIYDECTSIIGLSADEFNQVILLPQGKFERFLMAKGSEKQAVLQTIFGTRIYRRIVEFLDQAASRLEAEVAEARETIAQQEAVISSSVDQLRELGLIDNLDERAEDLASFITYLETIFTELESRAAIARDEHAQAKSDVALAKKDVQRFDKAQELKELTAAHAKAATKVAKATSQVQRHDAAELIAEAIAERDELAVSVKTLEAEVTTTRSNILKAVKAMKLPNSLVAKLVGGAPSATPGVLNKEASKVVEAVEKALQGYEELEEVLEELSSIDDEIKELATDSTSLGKEIAGAEKSLAKAVAALTEAKNTSKALPGVVKEVEKLEALLELSDVDEASKQFTAAEKSLATAQAKFDQAQTALATAQAQRSKDLAGTLATMLTPGEPCLVCGSTEHPKKAKATSGAVRDIAEVEERRNAAFTRLTNAERDLADAQDALAEAKKHATKLPTAAEQKALYKKLAAIEGVQESIDDLAIDVDDWREQITELKEALSDVKKSQSAATATQKALVSRKAKLEASVKELGTRALLDNALEKSEDISELLGELEEFVDYAGHAHGEHRQAVDRSTRLLKDSDFDSEKSVTQAILDGDEYEEFEALVAEASRRARNIDLLTSAIGDDPVPAKRPDLTTLSERLEVTERAAAEQSREATTVGNAKKQMASAFGRITKIASKMESQIEHVGKARSIATVFDKGSGGASGQLGLEMWVQRTLFEEVCLVANIQLRKLSSNRYSLTLEQEEGGVAKRRGSGLDIYVLDTHTGLTRPVQTMSGGERFMASLALALALGEVVQRHAGGIELPCLFIDEGFGGLDGGALDLAIDLLSSLHAAGRTVGIITHVEAMQQQLPIGIQVTKSEQGSSLTVVN